MSDFHCPKEFCFPDCWKVSLVLTTVLNYFLVSLLYMVSKVFDRIVDHPEKCGLFSDFQYDFRSPWSTAKLPTVVSDRIGKAYNRSEAIQAVALDISKTLNMVCHVAILKCKFYGISGQIFGLIPPFLSNRQLPVVLDGKSSYEYWVNTGVCRGSILGPTLFLVYDLPNDVICNIFIYADDTTLCFKFDQASDLW